MLRNVKVGAEILKNAYIYIMKISQKKVRLIVSVIVFALAGLIFLLSWLLRESIQLREQTFDDNVSRALSDMIEGIETKRAYKIVIGLEGDSLGDSLSFTADIDRSFDQDSIMRTMMIIGGNRLDVCDTIIGQSLIRDVKSISTMDTLMFLGKSNFRESDSIHLQVINHQDSTSSIHRVEAGIAAEASDDKIEFMERLLSRIWMTDDVPIENRVDTTLIDSVLAESFKNAGINLNYEYGIINNSNDSIYYATTDEYNNLLNSDYKVNLFPYDFASQGVELVIHFPDRQIFIWKQVVPVLATILILMALILLTFVYTIRVIIDQKKSAQLMAEFVNNMTHEFKTPISTISLAAEAIKRDDLIEDKEQVDKFALMILAENSRMRRQTDKILQMAALEESDLTLKSDRLDLHQIIEDAVMHCQLLVKNRQGSIAADLKADKYILNGDKVHIAGIIYNLLDNAVKYSPEKPDISISTLNVKSGIYIRVADKGIGIKNENLKLVFNKYFRVSTGNRHDVKGFGLGLSYVKLMTEAHGGSIDIQSQYGKGTRVELFFPIKDSDNV
jgi:signal transduction histidine kinase